MSTSGIGYERFARAVGDAERFHRGQVRKTTSIPYLSHVIAVASLVLEAGGSQDEAIAAVLHDAAEDVQIPDLTGEDVLTLIRHEYGDEVARIVRACSDDLGRAGVRKPEWRSRKEKYLHHLEVADASTLLVSAADKLHNLRSIAADFREIGEDVWKRFSTGGDKRADNLWYYGRLLAIYETSDRDGRLKRFTREMAMIIGDLEAAQPVSSPHSQGLAESV